MTLDPIKTKESPGFLTFNDGLFATGKLCPIYITSTKFANSILYFTFLLLSKKGTASTYIEHTAEAKDFFGHGELVEACGDIRGTPLDYAVFFPFDDYTIPDQISN